MAPSALIAPEPLRSFLQVLHGQSLTQEAGVEWSTLPPQTSDAFDDIMRDKFIALDQDKSELVYHILRSIRATTIVEAGTSFGVSTIYMALAAAQNAHAEGKIAKVIATEKESSKAARAQEIWAQAGKEIEGVIDLRIGDLRKTLTKDLGEVDFLLLDSKLLILEFRQPNAYITISLDTSRAPRAQGRTAVSPARGGHHGG